MAVVVSLYLAQKSDAIKLKMNVGIRLLFAGDGTPAEKYVGIDIANLGDRPVNIVSVAWSIGKKNKRFCMQPVRVNIRSRIQNGSRMGKERHFFTLSKISQIGQPSLPVVLFKTRAIKTSKRFAQSSTQQLEK